MPIVKHVASNQLLKASKRSKEVKVQVWIIWHILNNASDFVIKFFINPFDQKVQILDQGVMSNGEIQEQKIMF